MDSTFIKNLRKDKGLTLQEMAEKIGCSLHQVYRWEHNKVKPSKLAVKAIKTTFNL